MSFILFFVCIVGSQFRSWLSPESHSLKKVRGRLIRANSHQSLDSLVEMFDKLVSILASIQEFMAGVNKRLDQIESSHQDHHPVNISTNKTVPMHLRQHKFFYLGLHMVFHSIYQIIVRPLHHLLLQCCISFLLLLMILD